jgi:FtsZ-interacting cell division protein ZipA
MKEKDNQTRTLIIGIILCIIGLILSSWYSSKMATVEYVDKKCLDTKSQIEADQTEIRSNLRDLNRKTDKILELMITEKK